jgi:hypothetical protein
LRAERDRMFQPIADRVHPGGIVVLHQTMPSLAFPCVS